MTSDNYAKQNGLYFYTNATRQNMKNHIEEHGTLDGMIRIANDKKSFDNRGNVKIPLYYKPYPDSKDGVHLKLFSKNACIHGRIYNKGGKDYAPELKQAKYTIEAQKTKFDYDEKTNFATNIKEGVEFDDDDITDDYQIIEYLTQYITQKAAEFKADGIWGKKKSCKVQIANPQINTGIKTQANDDGDKVDILIPYFTRKFSESNGYISGESTSLKIRDKEKNIKEVTRDNVNDVLPSRSVIKIGTSFSNLIITDKGGIGLNRYINQLMIVEVGGKAKTEFSFDSDEEETKEEVVNFDDDE